MPHSRKLIYSFLITLAVVISFSLLTSLPAVVLTKAGRSHTLSGQLKKELPPQSKTVDVVARVGGYAINTLSGWTSPFAEVSLSFQGITRKTLADETGFFIFTAVPFPDIPEELCLISQDVNQLPSFPLCLAPPPRNQNIEIQDILLSPTLSLEESKISAGKTTKASGMTFPHSSVEVYLFVEQENSFWSKITKIFPTIKLPKISIVQNSKCKVQSCNSKFKVLGYSVSLKLLTVNFNFELLTFNFKLIKSAYAANFPVYETKSNENGYFEFSLPSSEPSTNRLFVSAIFNLPMGVNPAESAQNPRESQSYSSPKSNTLAFQVIGLWGFLQLLWKYFLGWIIAFRFNCDDLWLIVLIEILILMVLLFAVLAGKGKRKKETQRRLKEIKGTPSSIILYHPLKIL